MSILNVPEITVKVVLLNTQAILPRKAHPTDAGFDLAIPTEWALAPQQHDRIDFGLSLEIPPGWYGQVYGRSSMFHQGLFIHPGVIDADYRGSMQILIANLSSHPQVLNSGDRVAQLLFLPVPNVTLTQVSPGDLSQTTRGAGGLGSTGR